jgi:hypothetical protein
MSQVPPDPSPPIRRSLEDLDEAIADPAWLEAKKRRQKYGSSTWIGILLISLVALGFVAWRAYGSKISFRRDNPSTRAVDGLSVD